MKKIVHPGQPSEKLNIRSLEATTESIAVSLKMSTARFIKNIAMRFQQSGVDREGVANLKDLAPLIREIRTSDKEMYEEMHDLLKRILFFVAKDAEGNAISKNETRDMFMNLRDMYAILNDVRKNEAQDLEAMTEEELLEALDDKEAQ